MRRLRICKYSPASADGTVSACLDPIQEPQKELGKLSVDDALAKSRELIAEMGYTLRSMSVGVDGHIHAVVWKGERPNRGKVPGWIWNRPPSSTG